MSVEHSTLQAGEQHVVANWQVASVPDLENLLVTFSDIGKHAWVKGFGHYVLANSDPITWERVSPVVASASFDVPTGVLTLTLSDATTVSVTLVAGILSGTEVGALINAAIAATAADRVQTGLDRVQTGIDAAAADADRLAAEAAAAIAAAAGLIFDTTAAGIAATNGTTNKYFYVPQAYPSAIFYDLYKNVATVATYVNSYPSSALVAALQQTADDAGVNARAAALSIQLGGTDPEVINAIQTAGGYFNFLATDNLLSGIVRSDFQAFGAVAYSRASTGLALNTSGVYQSFVADVIRKTNKGVLLEAAATTLVQAPTTLNGAGWTGSGQTLTTGIATPNSATDGTSVTQTGATDSGRNLSITPSAAGDFVWSLIMKKEDIQYTLFTFAGGGYGATQGLAVDWNTSTPTLMTTGIGAPTAYSIKEVLSGGWYRIQMLVKPTTTATMSMQLRSTSDGTYAGRGSGATASQKLYSFWHTQFETGTVASSPILTAGTRAADVCSITWAGSGLTTDTASVNYTTGQVTTLTRAAFADSSKFNLLVDSGAWLGSYITSIVLTPAQPTSFRTINQRDTDVASTLIAGSISPLVASVRSLLAANGLGWMSQRFGGRNTIEATDNGATPYLYEDGTTHYWNGRAYNTEPALLAASNGVRAGNTVTFGAYVDTSVDLLGGISFLSGVGGFEVLSANSALSFSAGKLIHTSTATPNGWRMNLKGFSGKALAFRSNCRRTTAGALNLVYSKINGNFGGAQSAPVGTTVADVQVIGSAGGGTNFWIGGIQSGGGTGATEYNNARLYEAAPCQNFPNGNWTLYLEGVAPAGLPASTEVLAQGDIGANNDRFRIEYRTDGSVYLVQDSAFGQVGVAQHASVLLGSLTLSSAYKIAVSLNRSEILGGCNGATGSVDTALSTAIAYLRIGRSLAGEAFSGTITKYVVYSLSEKQGWFKRITTLASPAAVVARTPRRLLLNGDSYMANGSTGLGLILDDLGYESVNLGVGGSTFAEQYTAFAAATQYHDFTYVWYDGSPNGHTAGQYLLELTDIQDSITALGHNRWLYIRSGQIPGSPPAAQKADMDALYNKLKELYGEVHVYDPQPKLATLAITDSTAGGYADDQTDLGYGQFPRSLLYDGIHLTAAARRALALDLHKKIEAVRQLT